MRSWLWLVCFLAGLIFLWPSAAIVAWGLRNGSLFGSLEGLFLAAISGPLAGGLIVAGVMSRYYRNRSP